MVHLVINRREFQRLTMAAFGGMLVGARVAHGNAKTKTKAQAQKSDMQENSLLTEPHVCRGLNTCRNRGATGKNSCAGQGLCATARAHVCAALNECKGQGGCGERPGENACKGRGSCAVPLVNRVWPKARTRFEKLMKKGDVGRAPPPEIDTSSKSRPKSGKKDCGHSSRTTKLRRRCRPRRCRRHLWKVKSRHFHW